MRYIFNDPIVFSAGETGKAVIIAYSIGDDKSKNEWSGIIFESSQIKVYSESCTVQQAFTIPEGETLTIEKDKTLIVNNDVIITNNCAIHLN